METMQSTCSVISPKRTAREVVRSAQDGHSDESVVHEIARGVARRYGVRVEDIMSASHRPAHAAPRFDLWTCLWGSGWSYSRIARAVHRDIQSVNRGVKRELARMGVA